MNGRTRGRPPRISRDQIVAAARSISASDLTMQAVADALGVSRKALHYYVGDRAGLLTLMVLDQFERELAPVELPTDDDWRVTLRAYAVAYRDGLIKVGATTDFTQLRGLSTAAALALADRVLDALLSAGLDPDSARHGLTAASNIAQSAAQTVVAQTGSGVHRHRAETTEALLREPEGHYPALRRVLESAQRAEHDGQTQFEFELDAVIARLDSLLDRAELL
ncbi:TetR/AcrR family transcriptional regulator [Mycolicibacterium tusciae]|uniref:TetR/AcrR family transcriptional regulator n=1 Tax=Mycolicibacterium tusciae TaxID=75922 RepID=UPI00024A32DB|nr:TetR/AcrR family transcriptional regulator C-terminal domain-containing protein [Mycolicibacterium tusciae]